MEPSNVSSFELLGKRWSAMIVQDLVDGPRRFRELLGSLGRINDKVLAQRLKELEGADVITRKVFAEVPIRVEYSLNDRGRDLVGIVMEMERWDARWANGSGRVLHPEVLTAHEVEPVASVFTGAPTEETRATGSPVPGQQATESPAGRDGEDRHTAESAESPAEPTLVAQAAGDEAARDLLNPAVKPVPWPSESYVSSQNRAKEPVMSSLTPAPAGDKQPPKKRGFFRKLGL